MLQLYIRGRSYRTDAKARYDENTGKTIVLEGSIVSEKLADYANTRKIRELRKISVDKEGVLRQDMEFDNPTMAAQFVCGYSVSGPVSWHIEKHKNLATWLKENKES